MCIKFSKRQVNIIAVCLLALMFVLAFFSMRGDSATMDEVAHIPAGYSYVRYGDYRINPEHPPLLKDMAGLPLLAMDLKFPTEHSSWAEDINGQWSLGPEFLYKSGNDADKMIFWARLPFLFLMLLLGYFIFHWGKLLYGNKAALLALFFYALSPTFIAHSRLVTTDLGIAAFIVIATYFFIKALKKPSWQNILVAGITFGLAELVKFSTILLLPFFGLLVLAFAWSKRKKVLKNSARYLGVLVLIFIIGYLLVWIFYIPHVINYPIERQQTDIDFTLSTDQWGILSKAVYFMAGVPVLRAFAQYLFGLFMVFQRTMGGNTTYFLGEVSNVAWLHYFPMVYVLKVPLALHILTIISLLWFAWQIKSPFWIKPIRRIFDWVRFHFTEFAMLLFLAIYWTVSIKSNLNIGVRHVLPTFPFVYILISGQIVKIFDWVKSRKFISLLIYCFIVLLLCWYAAANFLVYPHYLAYFNEIIGGPKNGHKYVVDSNVDWGQDLKRLAKFVDENKIDQIKVDYFGGGSPEYYLGEKFIQWRSSNGPTTGWIAVSATLYQTSFGDWENSYWWLKTQEPFAVIGHSILVYHID